MDARCKVSVLSQSADSEQLHTLINEVTGDSHSEINISTLPSYQALLELDEMSVDEFYQNLKAGIVFDMVIILPEFELYSLSFLENCP